jgi:putative ABC transport system substrate-binding protein
MNYNGPPIRRRVVRDLAVHDDGITARPRHPVITRRAFMGTLGGGLLVAPRVAEAQPAGKVYRVGLLAPTAATPAVQAFRQGLRELGWIEGQNLVIDQRFGEGVVDRLAEFAAELVRLNVDVIAAGPTPPALAAKNATATIPIVILGAADPVELGLVASLARPGGNVTGLAWSVDVAIIGKGLELLKETLPRIRLVAVLWNPANPAHSRTIAAVKTAALSMGLQLQLLEASQPGHLEPAFAAMGKQRAQAVLVMPDGLFVATRARVAELETKYRLPSVHGLRLNVEAGALMSYGPDIVVAWRRGAFFVDRILKGARPADLPVEQPTKYELVVNLRTARARGLTIAPAVLARADEVLQ